MGKSTQIPRALVGSLALIAVGACGKGSDARPDNDKAAPPVLAEVGDDVLVTVNGVPIRQADLQFALASKRKGRGADKLIARKTLEEIVDQELARQAAQSAGLADDPEYQRKLRFMEAPVNDFQRETLSQSYFKKLLAEVGPIGKDEARAHFEKHPEQFQTEFRIAQIFVRNDEGKIQGLKKSLDGGTPFADVAATLFPANAVASGKTPWILPPLRWHKLPAPWQEVLPTMKAGEVSDIIRGPSKRAWIIRLIERKRDEAATFESLEAQVVAALQDLRAREKAQEAAKDLRRKASVVHVRDPEPMPPAPEPD